MFFQRSGCSAERFASRLALLVLVGFFAGCATRPIALPKDSASALPWGAIDERTHDVEIDAAASREASGSMRSEDYDTDADGRPNYALLTLSGGGSRGAFGAGLLTGWLSADALNFKVVTGVSTGALMATPVFLGPSTAQTPERLRHQHHGRKTSSQGPAIRPRSSGFR